LSFSLSSHRGVDPYGPEAGKEKIQQEDLQNLYPVKFMAIMSDAHLTGAIL
jgi:hypothetical protein